MHRRLLSVCFLLFSSVFVLSAQDSEWFWNKPISKIEFSGLRNVKKSDLTGITGSYIDQPFSDELYNDILDRLYSLDYFEDINPYAKHNGTNENDVVLVLEVIERPIVKSITFEGNRKIRNGELREQVKLKTSDIYVESKMLVDERIIRNHYLQKGYTTSKISHSIEQTEDGINIKYIISEGENTVIKEIVFSGNTVASARTLKNKMELKEVSLFKDGAYQPSTLERDKQKIVSYYREHGYADANVLDVKVETQLNEEKQRNELVLTFIIQEGQQYTYAGISISGNEVFTKQELLKQPKLKKGAIYNETKFQEDLSNIQNVYYENGYMTNDFSTIPVKDTDRHEISYDVTITERSRSHIENIIIKGNSKTKEYVITREIPIQSGDIFSRDKIINGLRNLMNLQYFSNVVPEPQPGSEDNLVDLVWTVEEQPTSAFQFGLTFSGVTDPNEIPVSLFLKVENSNLFGEGKVISASTTLSNTEQSLDFSYSQNWLGSLPVGYSSTLSFTHSKSSALINYWTPDLTLNQRNYYMTYDSLGVSFTNGLSRRWYPDYAILSLTGGIGNSISDNLYDESLYVPVDIGVSDYANRIGLTNWVYTSFSADNRDVNYDPTKGWFGSQRFAWYGLLPGIEKEFYLKSDTKLEGYFKLFDLKLSDSYSLKLVFAAYTGLTMLLPTSTGINDSSKIYIDGMFNGRGWTDISKYVKGQAMLSNRLELRVPLVPNIIGVDGFFDAVAVKDTYKQLNTLKTEDFYFSYGPGIRFLMPQFPLHLMFAWRFRIEDGAAKYDANPFQFVLSFNLINR